MASSFVKANMVKKIDVRNDEDDSRANYDLNGKR